MVIMLQYPVAGERTDDNRYIASAHSPTPSSWVGEDADTHGRSFSLQLAN